MTHQNTSPFGEKCSKCGKCLSFCPVYKATLNERFSPRGKVHLLSHPPTQRPTDKKVMETIKACLQCGACSTLCPSEANVAKCIRDIRDREDIPSRIDKLILRLLEDPGSRRIAKKILSKKPKGTGIILRLLKIDALDAIPMDERAFLDSNKAMSTQAHKARAQLFVGCLQDVLFPAIPRKFVTIFTPLISFNASQVCCGLPAWSSGLMREAKELVRKNIRVLHEGPPIVTLCTSCAYAIKKVWPTLFHEDDPDFVKAIKISQGAMDLTAFLCSFGNGGIVSPQREKRPVICHTPCHEKFLDKNRTHPTWTLLKEVGFNVLESHPGCCGHGGMFSRHNRSVSSTIIQSAIDEVMDSPSEALVTTCSGCLLQWKTGLNNIPQAPRVLHLLELLFP